MDTRPVTPEQLSRSVIAVPPLARTEQLNVCRQQNQRLIRYLEAGGVSTLLYGGNAVFYHLRPSEYAATLEMLREIAAPDTWLIPSLGPAFGVMLDQADILREMDFPTAMILPQREVADSAGIARGISVAADRIGRPIVLYLKHDRLLCPKDVGRLERDGCVAFVKYAVVLDDPRNDSYLDDILEQVPPERIVSGMGEQPAIVHLREFGLQGFTSGCVCVAPSRSQHMLRAIQDHQFDLAEQLRRDFEPLEDIRNRVHPIRVLHRAVSLAGIADTGPLLPLLSELDSETESAITAAATSLLNLEQQAV